MNEISIVTKHVVILNNYIHFTGVLNFDKLPPSMIEYVHDGKLTKYRSITLYGNEINLKRW